MGLILAAILFTVTILVVSKLFKQYKAQETRRNFYLLSGISAGIAVLGMLTMGLIGMLIFPLSNQLIILIYGFDAFIKLHGDTAWPIAFFVSSLWPFGFIICHIFNQCVLKTHFHISYFFLIVLTLHLIAVAGYWINPEVFDRLFIRQSLPENPASVIWPLIPLFIYVISTGVPKFRKFGRYFLFFFLLIVWENIVSFMAYILHT